MTSIITQRAERRGTDVFVFSSRDLTRTLEDHLFRGIVVVTMLLEIIVYMEPAPVDVAIIFCLGLGLFLGKLSCRAISTFALLSIVVFVLGNLVSMHNPFDLERAVWYISVTLYLVVSWLFFVGVISWYGPAFMNMLINAYCVAGLISAILGIGGYFHLLPGADTMLLAGRARGLFKDCNVYGPFFVPMALFSLMRLVDSRTQVRAKAIASFMFLFAAAGMLLCFSRGCWLNFGVALAVFFLVQLIPANFDNPTVPSFRKAGIVIVAGGLAVYIAMGIPAIKEMLSMRVTETGFQKYDRVRFATQRESLEAAEEHPLGIGPGQAEEVFGYATHSMYMRILSENGPIALLAMLSFVGATAARALKVARQVNSPWLRNINLVVFACIIGHLANSVVIDTVHWRHIWFIYALPWAPLRFSDYSNRLPLTRPVTRAKSAVAI